MMRTTTASDSANAVQLSEIGRRAVVVEAVTPTGWGRVRLNGTTWTAVSYVESFDPGDVVTVIGNEGITLIVDEQVW